MICIVAKTTKITIHIYRLNMSDDLKISLRDLKKKMYQQKVVILAEPLEKIDMEKQGEAFSGFVGNILEEVDKSSNEYKYIETISKEFDGMRLEDIRFALEKSFDRYNKINSLVQKYEENFDEKEVDKYSSRLKTLEKMLNFMIINSIGEYKKRDED